MGRCLLSQEAVYAAPINLELRKGRGCRQRPFGYAQYRHLCFNNKASREVQAIYVVELLGGLPQFFDEEPT